VQFRALVDLFLRHHTQHHSAQNTVVFYRTQLGQLAPHLAKTVDKIGPADILVALDRANSGKSPTTQRHRAVAIDQLQTYALSLEIISRLWLAKVPKPTPSQRQRIPTDDETKSLMRLAHARFRLIYEGLRISGSSIVRPESDTILSPAAVATAATDTTVYRWGEHPGSGLPWESPVAALLNGTLAPNHAAAVRTVNGRHDTSHTSNLPTVYAGHLWVDLHLPAGGEFPAWQSAVVVLRPEGDKLLWVGLVLDRWIP
jgi:hypothetical protein